MIKKPTKVQFMNKELEASYKSLKNGDEQEKRLYKWIKRAINDLEKMDFVVYLFLKIEYLRNI